MKLPHPDQNQLGAYKEICRREGAALPVSPAYYHWFIHLGDEAMTELIRLLILDRSEEINSWVFATPRTKGDEDIHRYLETLLHLLALGFMQFKADGSLACFAPLGPDPTDDEKREIELRIQSSRSLFRPMFMRVLTEGRRVSDG